METWRLLHGTRRTLRSCRPSSEEPDRFGSALRRSPDRDSTPPGTLELHRPDRVLIPAGPGRVRGAPPQTRVVRRWLRAIVGPFRKRPPDHVAAAPTAPVPSRDRGFSV